jgi:hypothetical protein
LRHEAVTKNNSLREKEEIVTTTLTGKKTQDVRRRREAPLLTPTDLKAAATKDIAAAMNGILADVFALYI